jgi:DNA-binding MurR/RpiR family transcriptional regulator
MDHGPLSDKIIAAYDGMSGQLQTAARFMLERPRDVALMSMRQLARQAGVQPATMTRLAQRLGFDGFEAIRTLYAHAIRDGDLGFSGKAGKQAADQKLRGDRAVATEMLDVIARQVAALAAPDTLDDIARAARLLAKARRIYCLGLRSSYAVAWHFQYILSLFSDKAMMLDAPAGVGLDPLSRADSGDLLFAVSVSPYTRATIETARYAETRGLAIVAITDSKIAPLAKMAAATIFISTESPSFFHTMSPAFFVAETLAGLVAGYDGEASRSALHRLEGQLAAFHVHLTQKGRR